MLGLAIDDALANVVSFDANRHEEKLRGEFTYLSWTESPLLAELMLGRAPVTRHYLLQVVKGDFEAEFDVNAQATMSVMVDIPENISAMSWLLEVGAQMRTMFTSMQGERGEEILVVVYGALRPIGAV